ncbi:TetR/AcrR family transcriptional regulator C-terminal domain-containing protein [Cryobacterium sp. Hz9]|uniref:TetR/AcrR family transcriptional regulator C-terminal domain-containing protein n=1 Tax=Cryobacterium sp. Hz9 TaxID=1259167 RepID=UPI00106B2347|nr:TetR/AcrR family transcriptional regulator C-terminal domain-containing protein [Cryobacterium sp. Hz9]TFB66821.1 hypothetical protein E3N85_09600 [Cryobacterium sp. Hz9]
MLLERYHLRASERGQELQLRRLVMDEVARFRDRARALFENGPGRAIDSLAAALTSLRERSLLNIEDATRSATMFNRLVMGQPVNEAMLVGDGPIPTREQLRQHAAEATRR